MNRMVKEVVKNIKRKVDEKFGIKLSEEFNENKKFFQQEVKKERVGGVNVRFKEEDGVYVKGKEEVKGVRKSHLERLMESSNVEHG